MTPFDIDAAIRIVDPYHHDEGDDLAVRLGISADAVRRAKYRGYLPHDTAERIAHHIGWHIGDIWPAYWEWQLAVSEAERLSKNAQQRRLQRQARARKRAA